MAAGFNGHPVILDRQNGASRCHGGGAAAS
jgi:hypothetical protein